MPANATNHSPIAVLGAGSWGTALALVLARNGSAVTLWGHEPEHLKRLRAQRENRQYLPGARFPESLGVEADLRRVAAAHNQFLLVVPSRVFATVLSQLKQAGVPPDAAVGWGTKGFEPDSAALLSDVVSRQLGDDGPRAVVSGPSFAAEVARELPTALTVAATDSSYGSQLADMLRNKHLRVYTNDDMAGVQVGGAVKNVIAVATGISDGLGFGANTRAALITRGLAEVARLGQLLGARADTLMGLAGLGDLVLTCTDDQSRNRRLGLGLGRDQALQNVLADIGQEVESLKTVAEIHTLAKKHRIEMPISEQVYQVLYRDRSPQEGVEALLARDPARE